MLISFILFLSLFAVIGLFSARFSRKSTRDYYLASNSIGPWLVGLSAVATNNSGYMFIGVIGFTYTEGLSAVWLMVGWLLGDFVSSLFIHKKLRVATADTGDLSYIGVLARWGGGYRQGFQQALGILAFVFLLAYASAQLVAGSKALYVLLDWPQSAGAVVGAIIIVAYCLAGGIRASIWTDAAQSFVMITAMSILLYSAVASLGGLSGAWQQLSAIPDYTALLPDTFVPGVGGLILFVAGWFVAGFSVVGQPHIMVRFMSMTNASDIKSARIWYYVWFTAFYCMATAVGMLARVSLPETAQFDAELALPRLAMDLLNPVLVGLILAGIFAATMSTADSLVLSCSSALSRDILPESIRSKINSLLLAKGATVAICAAALGWALLNKQSVFNLVIMSWSTLACAFAPLLIVLALGARPTLTVKILMVVVGISVSLSWRYFGLQSAVYEGLPGVATAIITYLIAAVIRGTRHA